MAGTFTAVVLAEGQLPNAKGTLYTVPASTWVYVKFFRCDNVGGATETVKVYYKPGATSRRQGRAVLAPDESVEFIDDGAVMLEAGDLIEGESTNATSVDYVISGVKEV